MSVHHSANFSKAKRPFTPEHSMEKPTEKVDVTHNAKQAVQS